MRSVQLLGVYNCEMFTLMRATHFSGLSCCLQPFLLLTLLCSACSSDGSSSGNSQTSLPAFAGPATAAPMATPTAPAEATDPAGATEPAANSDAPAPSSAGSETPVIPQLTEPTPSEMSGSGDSQPPPPATTPPPGTVQGQPRPSARCGSGGAAPTFNLPNTLFSVPASYDGNTPLPVVIAFHAAGNPNTQLRGILGNTLDDDYIMFYPKSDGNGWSNGTDPPKVDAIFAALDANACYDRNRVFATGHSSGAQFVVQRLCAGESRWRAVATVASSVYCASWKPIPALVIHGIGDTERQAYGLNDGEGVKDIVPYRTSNSCAATFSPVAVDGCSSGGVQVDPGCRDFDGCSQRTRWCQHNDPQYGTSHHGVPCFGARVIKDFFDDYR
jgi:polyhydroxybutyrate depolymerase